MQALDVKFIDSYNYLPFALAKMPSAFGMKELKKGYFPHFFNTEANHNYTWDLTRLLLSTARMT